MTTNTVIEWADHTFNPWTGCTKVSPACDHCYAEGWAKRSGTVQWGPHAERRRTTAANWALPKRWNAQAGAFQQQHGRRQRVFCASLADVFDNAADTMWRVELFRLIADTPNLDWLVLTKRIGNARKMIDEAVTGARSHRLPTKTPAWPWSNVWLGATICNQAEADRDIPKLLAVPAAKRFLSIEPLLGAVDLTHIDINGHGEIYPLRGTTGCEDDDGNSMPDLPALDWVIVGGESGPGARPMHPDWARGLRDQCQEAGVPFLFKQHGNWIGVPDLRNLPSGQPPGFGAFDHCQYDQEHEAINVGKKAAGRLLDGRTWDEVPG